MVEKGQQLGEPDRISPKRTDSLGWISIKSTWYVVKAALMLESKLTITTGQCCDGSCEVRTVKDIGDLAECRVEHTELRTYF
jgi:hypothetical protein